MRIHSQLLHRSRTLEISLTPMIDVVFLLLVFFVWTSSFEVPEQLLPTSLLTSGGTAESVEVSRELQDLERVVVQLFFAQDEPRWSVNELPAADLTEVRDKLQAVAAIGAEVPVLIDPQDATPLRHVIATYDAARQAGFSEIQLAAGDPLEGAEGASTGN